MTAKRLISGALGLFVLTSVGFSVWREWNRREGGRTDPGGAARSGDHVIVYYMHAAFRCVTCNQIEAMARMLVDTEFAEDLRSGRLVWRDVDFQSREDLARRYDVASSCVVIVQQALTPKTFVRCVAAVLRESVRREARAALVSRTRVCPKTRTGESG